MGQKHGKSKKGARFNRKMIAKDLTEGQGRGRVRITIEGEREDVEKVIWNMRKPPREWS